MEHNEAGRFNVGDGWLEITQPEPGGHWVVSYLPLNPKRNLWGPWLSIDYPDMPTEGDDPQAIAKAIRDWWLDRHPLSARWP